MMNGCYSQENTSKHLSRAGASSLGKRTVRNLQGGRMKDRFVSNEGYWIYKKRDGRQRWTWVTWVKVGGKPAQKSIKGATQAYRHSSYPYAPQHPHHPPPTHHAGQTFPVFPNRNMAKPYIPPTDWSPCDFTCIGSRSSFSPASIRRNSLPWPQERVSRESTTSWIPMLIAGRSGKAVQLNGSGTFVNRA